jgi:hypothetical protein
MANKIGRYGVFWSNWQHSNGTLKFIKLINLEKHGSVLSRIIAWDIASLTAGAANGSHCGGSW